MFHFYEFTGSYYVDEKGKAMSRRCFWCIGVYWLEMALRRCSGKWHKNYGPCNIVYWSYYLYNFFCWGVLFSMVPFFHTQLVILTFRWPVQDFPLMSSLSFYISYSVILKTNLFQVIHWSRHHQALISHAIFLFLIHSLLHIFVFKGNLSPLQPCLVNPASPYCTCLSYWYLDSVALTPDGNVL